MLTGFDYAVLLILGFSIVLSIMRGAVREVLALLSWLTAFWVAKSYSIEVAPLLPDTIPSQPLRLLAAFAMLFLGALLIASLVTITLSELVKSFGLGILDKGLGAIFGLARGMLIIMVLILMAGLTSVPRQDFWRNAMFSAPLEAFAVRLKAWLPKDLAKRIQYEY